MWGRIFALFVKEMLALLKDRKSRFVLVGPPIIQLFIFGYASTFDLNDIPFAVYNEDQSLPSRELVARFDGAPAFQRTVTIDHHDQIAPLIENKKVLLVLRIGPRFSRDLYTRGSADVQLLIDGRNSNTALLALNYVQSLIARFNEQWAEDHQLTGPPARLEIRAWFNPNLESRWFIVPGIVALLTEVVTIVVTALSVAREREQGTFDQLLVTPLRPVEIVIGKALPGMLVGLLEASFIVAMTVAWFEIPLTGSLAALYLGLILFLFSTIGVGLMISSIAVTQQQGMLGAFLFIVPSVILSGFATPIANMPQAVQTVTFLNPMRYFLIVIRGVFLEGLPVEILFLQLWPMAIIGLTSLSLAGWLFRRRMY